MTKQKVKKRLLSPKARKILDIVITSVEALVIVGCLLVSILVWVGAAGDPQSRSLNWFAIRSDSMIGPHEDSFNPGDLVVSRRVDSLADLRTEHKAALTNTGNGVVISFMSVETQGGQQYEVIITHRVVRIEDDGKIYTKGDNAPSEDASPITFDKVVGVFDGKAEGLGGVILWLQGYKKVTTAQGNVGYDPPEAGTTPVSFLVILIPLVLLFGYNIYVVIKWVADEKAKKIKAAAIEEARASAEDAEAIKRRALEDFMRSQGMTDADIAAYFASSAPTPAEESTPAEETPAEEVPTETPADGE